MKRLHGRRFFGLALLLGTIACGSSDTPTMPTQPATTSASTPPSVPPPLPRANLVLSGQGSWTNCIAGSICTFAASIQNDGVGCARDTAVTVRFFDGSGAQVGSDYAMGAVGGLSAMTIRPQQVVALGTTQFVDASVVSHTQTYRLLPSWTDVSCP